MRKNYHLPDLHNIIFSYRTHYHRFMRIPWKIRNFICVSSMNKLWRRCKWVKFKRRKKKSKVIINLQVILGDHLQHLVVIVLHQSLINPKYILYDQLLQNQELFHLMDSMQSFLILFRTKFQKKKEEEEKKPVRFRLYVIQKCEVLHLNFLNPREQRSIWTKNI